MIYLRRLIPLSNRDSGLEVLMDIGQEITQYEKTRSSLESMRDGLEERVQMQTLELQDASTNLRASNIALSKLIEGYNNREKEAQNKILRNLDLLVLPYLKELEHTVKDNEHQVLIALIKTALDEITIEFGRNLDTLNSKLSPVELKVAHLIRNNYETEEIAEFLHIEANTVFSHRRRIRKKLGLSGKARNLKSYLLSIDDE